MNTASIYSSYPPHRRCNELPIIIKALMLERVGEQPQESYLPLKIETSKGSFQMLTALLMPSLNGNNERAD